MRNIFVTCKVPGSYFVFLNEIQNHLQDGHLKALVLVPVNRAVRRFKNQLVNMAPNQALIDPPVFTFDQLLLYIYKALPQAKRIIPTDTLLILVQEILENQTDDFQYLTRGREVKSGLVRRVWETTTELRSFGFSSSELVRKQSDIPDMEPEKFEDFVRLLSLLEEKLGAEFIDEPFARSLAAQQVTEEQFCELFPEVQEVYISGYGLFSPPMLDFIKRVSDWLPVHVQLDYLQANPELFGHTLQALEKFKVLDAHIEHKATPSFLARFLFNRQSHPEKADLQQHIYSVALTNREQEVAFIAGKIRQLNAQGVPLHKIAVTFSHLEKYARTIRQVFEDFGIPYNLSTGFELLQSPLIATFLELIKIIEENFPTLATFAFLQNQFVSGTEYLDLNLLKQLTVKARIQHLNEKGLRSLEQFIALLKEDEDSPELDEEQVKEQIAALLKVLQPLFAFPEEAAASQFRNSYLELCEHLGLLRWYTQQSEHLTERQKEHNFRAYNRFVKVFERSIWSLNLLYGQQPIKRRRLLESLQRALLTATYNLTEWPDFGVQILPRLEVLALDFEVLFIGGLVDGDFPRASVKDIFFNDHLRSELGLTASEELLEQDRFLFFQLLESGAQKVYLTFPQFQDEEALVPSSFLADLKDVTIIGEETPKEDDPLFENRQKLWADFGQHVRLITQDEHREAAVRRLQLLQALQQGSEDRLAHLLQQIRISLDRNMGLQFSAYEGNLTGFPEIRALLQKKFGRQTWSVSRLETYAQCPMKFFLRYVLKVEPPAQIEDELTAQERGLVLHRILFRFFAELKQRGQQHQAFLFDDLLKQIALEELAKLPYQGLFWEIEKNRFLGDGQIKGILPAFLEAEEKLSGSMPFVPQYFELSFGFSGDFPADPNSVSRPVTLQNENGQLRLQGRIDRIDLDENGHAAIIDYKTGQVGYNLIQEVLTGKMLQIPLYLFVLPKILPDVEPVFGGLYSLKDPQNIKLTPVLADRNCESLPSSRAQAYLPHEKVIDEDDHQITFDEALERSLDFALHYVQNIQAGKFHHTLNPSDRACQSYCEYRRMCQKTVGKLERIAEKELEKGEV